MVSVAQDAGAEVGSDRSPRHPTPWRTVPFMHRSVALRDSQSTQDIHHDQESPRRDRPRRRCPEELRVFRHYQGLKREAELWRSAGQRGMPEEAR